jgi:hypothetical protein
VPASFEQRLMPKRLGQAQEIQPLRATHSSESAPGAPIHLALRHHSCLHMQQVRLGPDFDFSSAMTRSSSPPSIQPRLCFYEPATNLCGRRAAGSVTRPHSGRAGDRTELMPVDLVPKRRSPVRGAALRQRALGRRRAGSTGPFRATAPTAPLALYSIGVCESSRPQTLAQRKRTCREEPNLLGLG